MCTHDIGHRRIGYRRPTKLDETCQPVLRIVYAATGDLRRVTQLTEIVQRGRMRQREIPGQGIGQCSHHIALTLSRNAI
jgi:hypothetical protein